MIKKLNVLVHYCIVIRLELPLLSLTIANGSALNNLLFAILKACLSWKTKQN